MVEKAEMPPMAEPEEQQLSAQLTEIRATSREQEARALVLATELLVVVAEVQGRIQGALTALESYLKEKSSRSLSDSAEPQSTQAAEAQDKAPKAK
jgi:hypothetical protein